MDQFLADLKDSFSIVIPVLRDWWYLIVPAALTYVGIDSWVRFIRNKFWESIEYTHIAINVPEELEKSPMVMEQIFISMFGMQAGGTWSDKFWRGRQQLFLSLEYVGIGGHLRFVIRTPTPLRDFVEAQIYAEYPEAEIVEVEDYTQNLTWEQVDRDYDYFAAELTNTKADPYPIKTYMDFEHGLTQQILDPVSLIAESMVGLNPGENVWIQILVAPAKSDWVDESLALVNKLMKRPDDEAKILPKVPGVDKFLEEFTSIISRAPEALAKPPESEGPLRAGLEESPEYREMFITSPGERTTLEAIERSYGKPGFKTKIRFIYAAPKGQSRADSVVASLFGIFWQFGTQDLNGFMPHKKFWTKIDYFLPKTRTRARGRNLFRNMQARDFVRGAKPFILTSEELATVYHFPSIDVQAPQMERIDSRKGAAPANLPVITDNPEPPTV